MKSRYALSRTLFRLTILFSAIITIRLYAAGFGSGHIDLRSAAIVMTMALACLIGGIVLGEED